MKQSEKDYLMKLADNEFNKYLFCLNKAKMACEKGDKKMMAYFLYVASLSLGQSAAYRNRRSFL